MATPASPEEIPDEDAPLAGPGEDISEDTDEQGGKDSASGLEDAEDLEDEETPLADYSYLTGDERHTAVWMGVSLASLAAILWLAVRRRKGE